MPQKILILGIGNVLYADEGIGVHFAKYFQAKYQLSGEAQVDFVDGGTLAQALIPTIAKYDHVIICDTVNSNTGKIGDAFFFDFDKVPNHIDFQGSAHEVEMLHTLAMMDMVGDRPTTYVLGVIPEVLEAMSFALTQSIIDAVPAMEDTLCKHLSSLGMTCTQQAEPDIQAIAHASV
ncbi:HyaD/HybD family hydrogenase maturation endopeptidase [Ferrimonas lipolytica]|uniref:Hydrogenase maturation protease n=1 Tax=Ferrimonas lipolytica TaxID=2724191 RepID=A0A6H1UBJ0_9GAMM|nr:HyaD/HybD family hydrogenase maturation endopeptidase [Ferrimonas lipolytica]QIZ76425.1 hydrogenase maturation protease [Ferrimonas lipolytica]